MLYVQGMLGLGDNIYQRGVIEILSRNQPCWVETPWPQLYRDLPNVFCVPAQTRLRTQMKNVQRSQKLFHSLMPHHVQQKLRLTYVPWQRQGIPLYQGLCYCAQVDPKQYFLSLPPSTASRKEHVVIRPHTLRIEWTARNRGPNPEAIQWAIDWCNAKGLETIVVADIQPPLEDYDGPRPQRASRYFERGELSLERLIELFQTARFVVGTVGFSAPLSMAIGVPCILLHGGAGGLNGPEMINAPCRQPLRHVLPRFFCRCMSYEHHCDRNIPREHLEQALNECYEQTRTPSSLEVGERNRTPAAAEVVPV